MNTFCKKNKQILLFITMFLFIFGWKITNLLDIIFIISIIFIFYIAIKKIKLDFFIIILILFLWMSIIYGFGISIVKGAFDLTFITRTIRVVINTLGAYGIIYLYKNTYYKQKNVIHYVLRDLEYVILLHAVIIVIMYLSPIARAFIYSHTHIVEWGASGSIKLGYRIAGLTYALSQTSVIQMWGILLLIYNHHTNKNKNYITFLGKLFVLILSVLFTGRTGLLLGIIFVPLFLLLINKVKLKVIFKYLFRFSIGIIAFIFILFIFKDSIPDKFINYTIAHSSEAISVLTQGESETLDTIAQMFIAPEDSLDFLFGTSSLGRSSEVYIKSDVGFVKVLFAVGVVGSIIYYLCEIACLFSIFVKKKRVSDNSLKYLTFIILITNLILNLKELAIYTRNQWSIIIILVLINYNQSKLNPDIKQLED